MPSATDVFAQTTLYSDDQRYRLIHLPPRAITAAAGVLAEIGTAFSALIVDKDEVTLILPDEHWASFADRLPDHRTAGPLRLITFDVVMEPDMIGFLALVSGILAAAQIPIFALSSFERDHILVAADHFAAAWDALKTAQIRQ